MLRTRWLGFGLLFCAIAAGLVGLAPLRAHADSASDVFAKAPKIAPFQGVRWVGDEPEVLVNGQWWELVSLNGVAAGEIVGFAKSVDDARWKKRIEEDLPGLLILMKHDTGDHVSLELKNLESGEVQKIENVAMTGENRQAIREGRSGGSAVAEAPAQRGLAGDSDGPLSREDARQDIEDLQTKLETRYSYLRRTGFDYRGALGDLSDGLKENVSQNDLKIQIAKVMARFGDGHSGVDELEAALPSGYAPFLVDDAGDGLVAFHADRSNFVSEAYPYVKSLDGVSIDRWVEAGKSVVPDGSPQFVRRGSIRMLRFVSYLRGEMGLPASKSIPVELETRANGPSRTFVLPLAGRMPVYGEWPRGKSRVIGGIGYLRIASMETDAAFLEHVRQLMLEFRSTRGLIIDVRGNGGGARDMLRELFPYFMRQDDSPRVVNVGAYRLRAGDDADAPEGYLSNREMYPIASTVWTDRKRGVLKEFAGTFKPEWALPAGEFSAWHYAVIGPSADVGVYFYDHPVVVLMDSSCFSATDIFLGAFKGWRNVTLMGTASGGGSARVEEMGLPHGNIRMRLASMASFKPDGHLYDGRGTEPDVVVKNVPTDLIGRTDTVLARAIERLDGEGKAGTAGAAPR